MKKVKFLLISLLFFAAVFAPTFYANAQTPTPQPETTTVGDQIVIANTYRLKSGEALEGNLAVIGGTATIEKSATMTGDIFLVGGTLTISGTVNGDVIAIGGAANIGDNAIINGNITTIGATINRSPLATIKGNITEQSPTILDFKFNQPGTTNLPVKPEKSLFERVLLVSLRALVMAAVAALLGLLLPEPIKRIANTLKEQPAISSGVGLLVIAGFPIVFLLMIITILLIPVAALALILLVVTFFYGWIVLGFEIGDKISELSHVTWPAAISAGIGTLLLTLIIGMANLIPCVGWILGASAGIVGLGCVVMARYGSSRVTPRPRIPQPPATTTSAV